MSHTIKDTDPHFTIDTVTRTLSTECKKLSLVQGDHNSERFTFKVPQAIEGHEIANCDRVQIHFINIDQLTKAQSKGVYEADDVVLDEETGTVSFSWLVEHAATLYQGSLHFVVRFICFNAAGNIRYAWNTAIHTGISVSSGIDNGDFVAEEYLDILNDWEQKLLANQVVSLEQTVTGDADGGENVWTATFGDGRTAELKVKNGQRGPAGLVGSIETISGEPLYFFAGTSEEYEALTEAQKEKLFAIITDDPAEAEIVYRIEVLETWTRDVGEYLSGLHTGTTKVRIAKEAEYADIADVANNANWADEAGKAGAVTQREINSVSLPMVSGDANYYEQTISISKGFYVAEITFGDINAGNGPRYNTPLIRLGYALANSSTPEIYRTVDGQVDSTVIIYGDRDDRIKVRHYNKTKSVSITFNKYLDLI